MTDSHAQMDRRDGKAAKSEFCRSQPPSRVAMSVGDPITLDATSGMIGIPVASSRSRLRLGMRALVNLLAPLEVRGLLGWPEIATREVRHRILSTRDGAPQGPSPRLPR